MPIEFECHTCDHRLRVGDGLSGRKGNCPNCGEELVVPHHESDDLPDVEIADGGESPEPTVLVEEPKKKVAHGGSDNGNGAPRKKVVKKIIKKVVKKKVAKPEENRPAPSTIDEEELELYGASSGGEPIGPEDTLKDTLVNTERSEDTDEDEGKRRRKPVYRRRRSSAMLRIGLPVCALLLMGLGVFIFWYVQNTKLLFDVTLEGENVELPDVKPFKAGIAELGLDPARAESMLSRIERSNETKKYTTSNRVYSSLMETTVSSNGNEFVFRHTTGIAGTWYRVSLGENPKLAKYIADNRAKWEAARSKRTNAAMRSYASVRAGGKNPSESQLRRFNRELFPNLGVGGLGFVIEALDGKQPYRCVYEDDKGVYFIMPKNLKKLTIVGRKIDGVEGFRAKVTVNDITVVKGEGKPPDKNDDPRKKDAPGLSER